MSSHITMSLIDSSNPDSTVHHERTLTEDGQNRLRNALCGAISDAEDTLIEAPTSLGKTHQIATTDWLAYPEVTDNAPVVHLHQTTTARDQAAAMSESAGVDHIVLKGRTDRCPVAAGEYDTELTTPDGHSPSEWFEEKCDHQGYFFSSAHKRLEKELGELPCQQDGGCSGRNQWDKVSPDENGDPQCSVIHATHQFAQVPKLIEDANVIIDERPDYRLNIHQVRLQKAINSLLKTVAPSQRYVWPNLVTDITAQNEEALADYRSLVSSEEGSYQSLSDPDTHRYAPAILNAMSEAKPAVRERYVGQSERTTVVLQYDGSVRLIRRQPPLHDARCVVGLDAYPSKRLWKQNTGVELRHAEIMSTTERKRWRREERELRVVQVGNHTRSLTGGWWNDDQRLKAKGLIRRVHLEYGDEFQTLITTSAVEADVTEELLKSGVEKPETMHYGEQNSSNEFGSESIGLLIGCNDPGDENILDLLAEQRLEAYPETIETEYGEERTVGRGFVGPDKDAAEEFLESVRAENVAQSIGRYGRNGSPAIVYVWNNVAPEHLIDETMPGLTNHVTDTKFNMLDVIDKEGIATTKQVADELPVSKEHVRKSFKNMVKQGVLISSERTGKHGADEFRRTGVEFLPTFEITN